jgi:omega-6 fatty acid desaturase (delta-12 desaturase)
MGNVNFLLLASLLAGSIPGIVLGSRLSIRVNSAYVRNAIAVMLTYFFGWPALLLVQVIPHFIASAIGTYLFYAQHNFPGVSFNDNAGWTYEKAAMESSGYIKTGPLWAWFTANIGYHHIHHLNARIPFYRLPEVFTKIPELNTPKTTSLHPGVLRCPF